MLVGVEAHRDVDLVGLAGILHTPEIPPGKSFTPTGETRDPHRGRRLPPPREIDYPIGEAAETHAQTVFTSSNVTSVREGLTPVNMSQ